MEWKQYHGLDVRKLLSCKVKPFDSQSKPVSKRYVLPSIFDLKFRFIDVKFSLLVGIVEKSLDYLAETMSNGNNLKKMKL